MADCASCGRPLDPVASVTSLWCRNDRVVFHNYWQCCPPHGRTIGQHCPGCGEFVGGFGKLGVALLAAGFIFALFTAAFVASEGPSVALAGAPVEPIASVHAGESVKVLGELQGSPGQIVLWADQVGCGSHGGFCWVWHYASFGVVQNGSSLRVDTSKLQGNIDGAPHKVPVSGGSKLEYLAGDWIALEGTISGSTGNYSLQADYASSTLDGLVQADQTFGTVIDGFALGAAAALSVGVALLALTFWRVRVGGPRAAAFHERLRPGRPLASTPGGPVPATPRPG